MTPAADRNVVLDASVFIRALVADDADARSWLVRVEGRDVRAYASELLYVEVAHALMRYVRGGFHPARAAQRALRQVLALPLSVRPFAALALPAFQVALDRGLSVYDASYVTLAEASGALLVTADRRLAAAASRAELLP